MTSFIDGTARTVTTYVSTQAARQFYVEDKGLSNIRFATATGGASPGTTKPLNQIAVALKKADEASIVPGSSRFTLGGHVYVESAGRVIRDVDPATGSGTDVGAFDFTNGVAHLDSWAGITNPNAAVEAGLQQVGDTLIAQTYFRAPVSPLRPGSFSLAAQRYAGGAIVTATADSNGFINSANIIGKVDYQSGVAQVFFGRKTGAVGETSYDMSSLIPGVTTWYPDPVFAATVRFSCVSYTYLPLDADVLGIDPVRLPTDGRVPIFRPGDVAVVHNTVKMSPATVSGGQTISTGRTRLARIRVIGNDGATITSGYTTDLDAGTITFTSVSGYSQPVTIEHRIEDMMMVREVQINGQLAFTRQATHDFPANTSFVSSALIIGDMQARVSLLFDQSTWTGAWSDVVTGSAASATFNDTQYPITVTNSGAITERWYVKFTNTSAFEIYGEHIGLIATGTTGTDCSPLNPATGVPYFTLPSAGWGGGWAIGNVLRFNTIGALAPVWVTRTIQQGPATAPNDSFEISIRGDIDRP